MSKIRLDRKGQPSEVLPYILTTLKDKISEITAIEKIILFGSRGRLPLERWTEIEGKDWDILAQAKCKIKNAKVWVDQAYHMDLLILDKDQTDTFCQNRTTKEIFPHNELASLMNKNENNGKI